MLPCAGVALDSPRSNTPSGRSLLGLAATPSEVLAGRLIALQSAERSGAASAPASSPPADSAGPGPPLEVTGAAVCVCIESLLGHSREAHGHRRVAFVVCEP